jgi:alcohol dehydrogenase (NADP+)
MIRMDEINEAFKGMKRADLRYRFVIDMTSLQER